MSAYPDLITVLIFKNHCVDACSEYIIVDNWVNNQLAISSVKLSLFGMTF